MFDCPMPHSKQTSYPVANPSALTVHLKLNRSVKLTVDSSTELQLRIELGVDGYLMEWPLPKTIAAREMLEIVFARRSAFKESKPFETWSLDAPQASQYEVCPLISTSSLGKAT